MTRLTFFIGNGFDINVGLKTRYKEFYEYYMKKNPDDMLAKAIGQNHVYWSDLELGLGRYTENIRTENVDDFWKSQKNLEQELANYLELQMKNVDIDSEDEQEVAIEMQRSLTEFPKELPMYFQKYITNAFEGIWEDIFYSFISFNYTDVFDKCLNITNKIFSGALGEHYCNEVMRYLHRMGEMIHIHGTINSQMILGVNDEEQVANKELLKNTLYKQYLIKPETNRRFDYGIIESAQKIIDESIIICVFGMSIGRTDKMWWRYICKWLEVNEKRLLVVYTKIEGKGMTTRFDLFPHQNDILDRLRKNADLSDEKWEKIKKQIYIKCNPKMFRFKIVNTSAGK